MNDKNTIDYAAVLADLENQRANIDRMIEATKMFINNKQGDGQSTNSSKAIDPSNIRFDAFVGQSIIEAARKCLEMVKTPLETDKMVEVLSQGGRKAKKATLYVVLTRQEREVGDIRKVKRNTWGLSEWYPGTGRPRKASNKTRKESEKEIKEAGKKE